MDDLRTQALLVDFDPTRVGTGAVGTVISRDEVAETKARGEFPATLHLELDRGGTAQARVAIEWDEDKARRNLSKHGVSFEEASTVFSDPFELLIHDPLHSEEEERFVSLAESRKRRLLVVVFTERGDKIRIISARKATRGERRKYEEGKR